MIEAIITLTVATGVLLGSPGPATLSLAAVGATFGVRSGASYLAGILMGLFCAMMGAVFGIAAFFVLFSQFLLPLQEPAAQFLATSLIVFAVAVIVDSIWLAIGSGIRSVFAHPRSARAIRILFALSIVFATLWTLLG